MNNLTAPEQTRFNDKWKAEGDCKGWVGPLDRDGYGTFYLRRKNRKAHRVAWYAANGPIPEGMVINHSCRNRACVNIQHLRLLTTSENALIDSSSWAYINSQKTVCPRGHAYDKIITIKGRRPARSCSICERQKSQRLQAKWRAEDTLAV